jgi:hypothetical protein
MLVIFDPVRLLFGQFTGFRIDPISDADFGLGLLNALSRLEVRVCAVLHVFHRLEQGGERAGLLAAILGLPIETVGTFDDPRSVEIGRCFWYRFFHRKPERKKLTLKKYAARGPLATSPSIYTLLQSGRLIKVNHTPAAERLLCRRLPLPAAHRLRRSHR